jgi:hypothetical protein
LLPLGVDACLALAPRPPPVPNEYDPGAMPTGVTLPFFFPGDCGTGICGI